MTQSKFIWREFLRERKKDAQNTEKLGLKIRIPLWSIPVSFKDHHILQSLMLDLHQIFLPSVANTESQHHPPCGIWGASNGLWLRNKFISRAKEWQWNKAGDNRVTAYTLSQWLQESNRRTGRDLLPMVLMALVTFCYVLNCVPPKSTCWSPNLQYLTMWLSLETGPLKRWLSENGAVRVNPNPFWLLCLHEKEIAHTDTTDVHTQRKDHERTQQEGAHQQAKERGLRRNQPCRHLDLGLPASRTVRNKMSCLRHPSCSILFWQPKQTHIHHRRLRQDQGNRGLGIRRLEVHVGLCRWALSLWVPFSKKVRVKK